MKKIFFLAIFLNTSLEASESFIDFNSDVESEWKAVLEDPKYYQSYGYEGPFSNGRYRLGLDTKKSQVTKNISELVYEEKCSQEYDLFCSLFYEIAKDKPPEYDDWLTDEENSEARKSYYSNKKINFVEFKLPFKALPLCDNDFVQPEKTSAGEHYVSRGSGRTVTFRNGAPSIHAKGISCYSITEEKFFAYIYGLRYTAATPLRKFDVLNPYAKYCGDGGKWYYYDYGIGINRSDSYKSGICLEFENEKNAAEALSILSNERKYDNASSRELGLRKIEHLVGNKNWNSYDRGRYGEDYYRLFKIEQTISNTLIKAPPTVPRKVSFPLIKNTLHVLDQKKETGDINSTDITLLEFSADRSFAKENIENIKLYVVVSIPLAEKQREVSKYNTLRDYYGYFKGYELILDNKILACTYNCNISK